jgi:hypothetical protein
MPNSMIGMTVALFAPKYIAGRRTSLESLALVEAACAV